MNAAITTLTVINASVDADDLAAFSAASKSSLYCTAEYNGHAPGSIHSSGTVSQQSRYLPNGFGQQASSNPMAAHLL